jgi:hypothetical protein
MTKKDLDNSEDIKLENKTEGTASVQVHSSEEQVHNSTDKSLSREIKNASASGLGSLEMQEEKSLTTDGGKKPGSEQY